MKRIILTLFVSIVFCGSIAAQDTLSYKPWASFEGDTVAYLEYNFNTRSKQYAGKKVADLLKDLELPVIEVMEPMSRPRINEQGNFLGGELLQVSLRIMKKSEKGPNPLRDYYITFAFKNPPLNAFKHGGWPQIYEVIKDLEISAVGTLLYKEVNPSYIEYMKRKQKQ
jgi:hypothetical protein